MGRSNCGCNDCRVVIIAGPTGAPGTNGATGPTGPQGAPAPFSAAIVGVSEVVLTTQSGNNIIGNMGDGITTLPLTMGLFGNSQILGTANGFALEITLPLGYSPTTINIIDSQDNPIVISGSNLLENSTSSFASSNGLNLSLNAGQYDASLSLFYTSFLESASGNLFNSIYMLQNNLGNGISLISNPSYVQEDNVYLSDQSPAIPHINQPTIKAVSYNYRVTSLSSASSKLTWAMLLGGNVTNLSVVGSTVRIGFGFSGLLTLQQS